MNQEELKKNISLIKNSNPFDKLVIGIKDDPYDDTHIFQLFEADIGTLIGTGFLDEERLAKAIMELSEVK